MFELMVTEKRCGWKYGKKGCYAKISFFLKQTITLAAN